MIKVGQTYFTCDECPLCEGVEFRLRIAKEYGYEPQFEYCGCDKLQHEFYVGCYCSDAFIEIPPRKRTARARKTGRAYRRSKNKAKKSRSMAVTRYARRGGYTDWGWKDGIYQPVGNHMSYPKNSHRQKYWKRYSNKQVRRHVGRLSDGSQYKRLFDYAWEVD